VAEERKRKRPSPLPTEIKKSKPATTKKVTRGTVKKYLEDMQLVFTPSITTEFWTSLRKKIMDGDREAMKLGAEIMGYVQRQPGTNVNVVANIANNNQVNGGTYDRSIDSIIRKLDTQDQQDQQVIDVTPR
jgi:hypothetical protein